MAIKINGNTVFSDSRVLQNIQSTDSVADEILAAAIAQNTNIDVTILDSSGNPIHVFGGAPAP